jgi:hypothetical protein
MIIFKNAKAAKISAQLPRDSESHATMFGDDKFRYVFRRIDRYSDLQIQQRCFTVYMKAGNVIKGVAE